MWPPFYFRFFAFACVKGEISQENEEKTKGQKPETAQPRKVRRNKKLLWCDLKQFQFDGQVFLRVLAEIVNQFDAFAG